MAYRKMMLSKSTFTRGLSCVKSLYLHKYHPELKDEVSLNSQMRFDSGNEVGVLARELFPRGIVIEFEDNSYDQQVERTRVAIEKGRKTIYEAAFFFDGVFIKADILHKGKAGWELYEVKSSTSVKDYYLMDAAIQHYVLKGAGINVTGIFLVHLNKDYVKDGDIDISQLFAVADITKESLSLQADIPGELERLRMALTSGMPDVQIGEQCKKPYECDFKGHCWGHIPNNSVFDLSGRGVNKFKLYRNGIIKMEDIPLDILNASQRMQVQCFKNQTNVIDKAALADFLGSLQYPLAYLDYETFMVPIPPYNGIKPYQQVPFQYSLHIGKKRGAELSHREFLAEIGQDPRRNLIEQLLQDLPDKGTIVVYSSFEKTRLRDLAMWFPEFQKNIQRIIDRLVDLSSPFKSRFYYCWQMQGAYSIKEVLPALVPELSYTALDIRDGGMAMRAYLDMQDMNDKEDIETTRKALLEYCKLDTFAMAAITDRLQLVVC